MRNIRYGVYDFINTPNHFYTGNELTDQVFYNKWRLLSPKQIQTFNAGICWDMSNFAKKVLNNLSIQNAQIYCQMDNDEKASHSFNIVVDENKFYIFDGAWKRYSRISQGYDDINLLFKEMARRMFNQHKVGTTKIDFFQIIQGDKYGCNCQQYMNNIYENNKYLITFDK